MEYMGTVTPSNYQGVIAFWRSLNTATFNDQTQYATKSATEVSDPGNMVNTAVNSHVFDIDAPGIKPDLSNANEVWRVRQNYVEYALLDHIPSLGSSSIALASLNVFARTSCTGPLGSPQFATDLPGDNTSGVGSTPLTWNFQ
jgi:hypothetical protein